MNDDVWKAWVKNAISERRQTSIPAYDSDENDHQDASDVDGNRIRDALANYYARN